MSIKYAFRNDHILIKQLQAGNPKALEAAIVRFGNNMAIAAYGWTEDIELTEKLIKALFIRLKDERYANAVVPLERYFLLEVKAECERLFGYVLSTDKTDE